MFGLAVVVVVVVVRIVVLVVDGAWVGGSAMPDMDDDEIDGRGLGTVRLEHASIMAGQPKQLTSSSSSVRPILSLSNSLVVVFMLLVECICRMWLDAIWYATLFGFS